MRKIYATTFSIVLLLAVLSPILENWKTKPSDGFPFSYYPMFSFARAAYTDVTYAEIFLKSKKTFSPLHHSYLGIGGYNQTRKQLKKIVSGSAKGIESYCAWVAQRVAVALEKPETFVIRLVTRRFNRDQYFLKKNPDPELEAIHGYCNLFEDEQE